LQCVCSVLQCVAVPKQRKLEFEGAYSCLPPGSVCIYPTEFIACLPLKFVVRGMFRVYKKINIYRCVRVYKKIDIQYAK